MNINTWNQRIRRMPWLVEGVAGLVIAALLLFWLPALGALVLGAVVTGLTILFRRIERKLRSLRHQQTQLEREATVARATLEAALAREEQQRAAAVAEHRTRHDQLSGLVTTLGRQLRQQGESSGALDARLGAHDTALGQVYTALQAHQDQIDRTGAGMAPVYETLQVHQDQIDHTAAQARAGLDQARAALTQVRAADRDARVVHKTLRLLVSPEAPGPGAEKNEAFDPEMALPMVLGGLVAPRAVDVGANYGEFTASLRAAGFTADTFEPAPLLATYLRARFRDDPAVRVHECAATSIDGTAELHPAAADNPETNATLFATLSPHPSYPGLHFGQPLTVAARRLDTVLAAEGPVHVGLLKTDTEGHDLEVLRGAHAITADVLLLEYWSSDFIFNSGTVKNTIEDYVANIDQTVYPHSVIMWRNSDEGRYGVIIDHPSTPMNSWGNILFARERPVVEAIAAWVTQTYGAGCLDRGPDRQEN